MFDYTKAHKTMVEPRMVALSSKLQSLIDRVKVEAAVLKQKIDFDVPWPEGSNLKDAFEALSDPELADLSRISYYYGHWSKVVIKDGWTWKVSNYCDQILRDRLGLGEVSTGVPRIFYEIHEGMLRICLYGKDVWTWDEVGPATKKNLEILKARFLDQEIKASKEINNLIKSIANLLTQIRESLEQTEVSRMFLDLDQQLQQSKSAN